MSTILGFLALIGAATTFGLWFRRIQAVDIPEDRTPWVIAALVSAALGIAALLGEPGWLGGVPAVVGVVVGGFFATLVGISRQLTDGAIAVGDRIPDASAPDDSGESVALSSFEGAPLLLKFFRGHW